MINYRAILNVLFALLIFLGIMLIFPALISFFYKENDLYSFIQAIGISISIGTIGFFLTRTSAELRAKDGFIIVTLGWILFSALGALPFYFSGYFANYTDCFFETMSGFSTTGASILTDIEALPHGILFWRSLTHWLGGMGIILLSLAILPLLGVGGMQLFKAEVPGPTPDKLTPRIKHTAELLWGVYVLLSVAEILMLRFAGMEWFDSVCHTFGTMATGGFSTKNASIAYYDSSLIHSIIIFFMILAGANFSLHYRALRGKPKVYWRDPEALFYISIIAVSAFLVTLEVIRFSDSPLLIDIRDSIFQVVSIITTTGYVTADYEQWGATAQIILLILMFVGGSAGSTGGGMKIIRSMILIRFGRNELKRLIHPQAVLTIRVGDMVIPREIVTNIAGFFLLYISLFVFGVLFMSNLGLDILTSIGSVAATIGNIGPGIGNVGPVDNYAHIPTVGKWFLSFLMLVGRLEIYTVIILFTKTFWKK
jgi:trk system potassium uptake protein TrkH